MPNQAAIKATGNCFENCGRYMLENRLSDMTLVHCTVTGTGSKVKGVEYSHSFLITEDGNFALDMTISADDPKVVPLELYRALGNVKNELHDSRDEAQAEMLRTEHFGAWDDSVVTAADRASIQTKRGPRGKRWS
jgi:hypothetical protein